MRRQEGQPKGRAKGCRSAVNDWMVHWCSTSSRMRRLDKPAERMSWPAWGSTCQKWAVVACANPQSPLTASIVCSCDATTVPFTCYCRFKVVPR